MFGILLGTLQSFQKDARVKDDKVIILIKFIVFSEMSSGTELQVVLYISMYSLLICGAISF